jgi:hypothetical protein
MTAARRQETRRTVSRFLVPILADRAAVIPLVPPLLAGSSDLPGSQAERATPSSPIWSCSAWGLPCHSGCPERGALLPHLFTLARRVAATGGMFSVALSVKRALSAPPRPLAGTLPCGDRTLPRAPAVSPLRDAPDPRLPVRRISCFHCFIRGRGGGRGGCVGGESGKSAGTGAQGWGPRASARGTPQTKRGNRQTHGGNRKQRGESASTAGARLGPSREREGREWRESAGGREQGWETQGPSAKAEGNGASARGTWQFRGEKREREGNTANNEGKPANPWGEPQPLWRTVGALARARGERVEGERGGERAGLGNAGALGQGRGEWREREGNMAIQRGEARARGEHRKQRGETGKPMGGTATTVAHSWGPRASARGESGGRARGGESRAGKRRGPRPRPRGMARARGEHGNSEGRSASARGTPRTMRGNRQTHGGNRKQRGESASTAGAQLGPSREREGNTANKEGKPANPWGEPQPLWRTVGALARARGEHGNSEGRSASARGEAGVRGGKGPTSLIENVCRSLGRAGLLSREA